MAKWLRAFPLPEALRRGCSSKDLEEKTFATDERKRRAKASRFGD